MNSVGGRVKSLFDSIRSRSTLTTLQVLFAFFTAIIANKLADAIDLPLSVVIITAGSLLTLSSLLAVSLARSQPKQEYAGKQVRLSNLIIRRGSTVMLSRQGCLLLCLGAAGAAFIIHSYIVVLLSRLSPPDEDSIFPYMFTLFLVFGEFGVQAILHKIYGEPTDMNTWQWQIDAMAIYVICGLMAWLMLVTPMTVLLGFPIGFWYLVVAAACGTFLGYLGHRWISPITL